MNGAEENGIYVCVCEREHNVHIVIFMCMIRGLENENTRSEHAGALFVTNCKGEYAAVRARVPLRCFSMHANYVSECIEPVTKPLEKI